MTEIISVVLFILFMGFGALGMYCIYKIRGGPLRFTPAAILENLNYQIQYFRGKIVPTPEQEKWRRRAVLSALLAFLIWFLLLAFNVVYRSEF